MPRAVSSSLNAGAVTTSPSSSNKSSLKRAGVVRFTEKVLRPDEAASPAARSARNACISVALRFAVPLVSTLEASAERPCSEGFSNASPPE